jgi:hypothetical protein
MLGVMMCSLRVILIAVRLLLAFRRAKWRKGLIKGRSDIRICLFFVGILKGLLREFVKDFE